MPQQPPWQKAKTLDDEKPWLEFGDRGKEDILEEAGGPGFCRGAGGWADFSLPSIDEWKRKVPGPRGLSQRL